MAIPIYLQQIDAAQRKMWMQREKKLRNERFREFENKGSFKPMDNPTPELPDESFLNVHYQNIAGTRKGFFGEDDVTFADDFKLNSSGFKNWFILKIWHPIRMIFRKKYD